LEELVEERIEIKSVVERDKWLEEPERDAGEKQTICC